MSLTEVLRQNNALAIWCLEGRYLYVHPTDIENKLSFMNNFFFFFSFAIDVSALMNEAIEYLDSIGGIVLPI